jgi:hypothetical protein
MKLDTSRAESAFSAVSHGQLSLGDFLDFGMQDLLENHLSNAVALLDGKISVAEVE